MVEVNIEVDDKTFNLDNYKIEDWEYQDHGVTVVIMKDKRPDAEYPWCLEDDE